MIKQNAEVTTKLEELTRLVTAVSQASARPASDGISSEPTETHATVSPGQQEDVEQHVGTDGCGT